MANAAPHDGSEIAIVGRGVAMEPILDAPLGPPKFDATKFTWLGSMNNEVGGFFVREPGPVATFQDVLEGRADESRLDRSRRRSADLHPDAQRHVRDKAQPVAGYPARRS